MNYTVTCVDILQSGRMLPPYLEYKLKVDPSGFFDMQVNFNQSAWCHILPSAIFVLHIQRGMKRIMFSFEHEGLYSPYCSCKFSDNLVVLVIIIIGIQPLGRSGQRPELSQATGMAPVRCILGKFLGVVCHCFPPLFRCSHFSPPSASTSMRFCNNCITLLQHNC